MTEVDRSRKYAVICEDSNQFIAAIWLDDGGNPNYTGFTMEILLEFDNSGPDSGLGGGGVLENKNYSEMLYMNG